MTVEEEFNQGCFEGYELAKKEFGYNATYYLQMLYQHGGLKTAKLLLASKDVPTGLMTLWENGRLDLSLENYLLDPKFRSLFTDEERKIARDRLKSLNFTPTWEKQI